MDKSLSKKIALRGLLVATAFLLSYIEMQIPYFFSIPGIKLGLTNLVVLIALYKLSVMDAFCINLVRIFLVGITFGNMAMLPYSLAGGILSFIVMLLLKKLTKSSLKFVSVMGGIFHNVGQIIVAMIVLENSKLTFYLPFLWISGIVAGITIGIICEFIIKRIKLTGN